MGMNALEVRRMVMLAQPHEAVASGAVASFRTDVVSPLPMEFDIVPIQAGTGDPSPENVRPITGHDGFTRIRTNEVIYDYINDPPTQGTLSGTTGGKANSDYRIRTPYIKVVPNTKYTIMSNIPYINVYEYSSDSRDSYIGNTGTWQEQPFTFTTTGTTQYIRFILALNTGTTTQINPSDMTFCYVLEDAVSEVVSTTFPTPPGTVYGGHVRDNGDGTGTLVVDRVYFVPTSISSVSTASTGVKYAVCDTFPYSIKAESSLSYDKNISSEYQFRKNAPTTSGWYRLLSNRPYIFDNRFTDVATAESIILDEKPQFVCEMDEPLIYTLSMTALQSLIGQNHIWVDNADSVTVEYWGH